MHTIRNAFYWIKRNFSNIFTIVGILLTVYLGIFYVPKWIKDNQNEKIRNSKLSLEQSIKELAYTDSTFKIKDVEILFHAKEIEINEKLPFSIDEILTQTQGSFMEDKYLSLQVRRHLLEKIELVKKGIPNASNQNKGSVKSDSSSQNVLQLALTWGSIIAAIAMGIAGFTSFYTKLKSENESQEELNNEVIEANTSTFEIKTALEYEKAVVKEIEKYPGVEIVDKHDSPFDLVFQHKGKIFYVEIKYLTQRSVGVNSFQRFFSNLPYLDGEFWFIYNTGVTTLVRKKTDQFNSNAHDKKIELINAPTLYSLRKKLDKLFR